MHRRSPANASGSQSVLRLKEVGIAFAVVALAVAVFAVVVTVTVMLSEEVALELITYAFNGLFVLIGQLAFGALVLQESRHNLCWG